MVEQSSMSLVGKIAVQYNQKGFIMADQNPATPAGGQQPDPNDPAAVAAAAAAAAIANASATAGPAQAGTAAVVTTPVASEPLTSNQKMALFLAVCALIAFILPYTVQTPEEKRQADDQANRWSIAANMAAKGGSAKDVTSILGPTTSRSESESVTTTRVLIDNDQLVPLEPGDVVEFLPRNDGGRVAKVIFKVSPMEIIGGPYKIEGNGLSTGWVSDLKGVDFTPYVSRGEKQFELFTKGNVIFRMGG